MADSLSARQQIVDKIKEVSNILVTVSQDPSVDQLSAALGLTIMLNNLKKHTTAVVSGTIPPAITFLEPEKTFEGTVDSLRDFIIALDKEKADHLRYKVDGDVVKIFITPYKITLSEADLDFSQGDYNVELVLALGVADEAHLDKALEAHGKILHDATVASLSAGSDSSKLGTINWHDDTASSLSEMLVSLSEAIKGDKPLLDEQSSSALLTGIVAATDRFSNDKTSSKVMTMSAQLMAAGANQQLIATKLQEAREIGDTTESGSAADEDGIMNLQEDTSAKLEQEANKDKKEGDDTLGGLAISHEKDGDIDEVAEQVASEATEAASKVAASLSGDQSVTSADVSDTTSAEEQLAHDLEATIAPSAAPISANDLALPPADSTGIDTIQQEDQDYNKTILNHQQSTPASKGRTISPINASVTPDTAEPPTVDVFSAPTLADIDSQARGATQPPAPVGLPPLPDFSTLPPPPTIPLSPAPVTTPQPSSGAPQGGEVSADKLAELFGNSSTNSAQSSTNDGGADPGQFKIPGQN